MENNKCCELEKLVEAGHTLFKAIESRDLAYEILKKFLECDRSSYSNISQDLDKLKEEVNSWVDYDETKKDSIKEFIEEIKSNPTLGDLALLFLLSWNMNRYKDCNNFSSDNLKQYADYLNEKLDQEILPLLGALRNETIRNVGWINIEEILKRINEILRNKDRNKNCFKENCKGCQREYIGAIKLASVLLPKIVIPIDNPIAEALGFKESNSSFSLKIYKKFWENIQNLTKNCPNLVSKLKQIDELFYVLFSLKQKVKDFIRREFEFGEEYE